MMIEPEDDDASAELERSGRSYLQRFSRYALQLVAVWRELRFAKKAGQLALVRYQRLRTERPELTGQALLEAFVCERNALEASAARGILQRAAASFATWPSEHDLNFLNVVQYLVISEYLASHPKRRGTTINMARTIAQVIPRRL
jgi:hypothetical protein